MVINTTDKTTITLTVNHNVGAMYPLAFEDILQAIREHIHANDEIPTNVDLNRFDMGEIFHVEIKVKE